MVNKIKCLKKSKAFCYEFHQLPYIIDILYFITFLLLIIFIFVFINYLKIHKFLNDTLKLKCYLLKY